MTWFESLDDEKKQVVVQNYFEWQNADEQHSLMLSVPFKDAFAAADENQDGLLNLEELKTFYRIMYAD